MESSLMPLVFIGHGSPANAVENNEFTRDWELIAQQIPQPKAILVVSAHWTTRGLFVLKTPQPKTIHDFYGFPQKLYNMQYPAPGAPEFADLTLELLKHHPADADNTWGLDHGSWSVLVKMYPQAKIPVYQLSIDYTKSPEYQYKVGQDLLNLRKKGVLIMGSGNIVHNLGLLNWGGTAYDWALEFDHWTKNAIETRDHDALINYQNTGKMALLSVPTREHYDPMLTILGASKPDETIRWYAEKCTLGSVSMRSFTIAG